MDCGDTSPLFLRATERLRGVLCDGGASRGGGGVKEQRCRAADHGPLTNLRRDDAEGAQGVLRLHGDDGLKPSLVAYGIA